MPFVKLDTAILDSTLWLDAAASRVFITALLMATPRETTEPLPQLEVRSLNGTGFIVPAGWYGFVPAAGSGIIRRALVPEAEGYAALEALGAPDEESRSHEFEGRRLVRVSGGFIVLNYMKFRDFDHGAKDRMKRLRDRKKLNEGEATPNVTDVTPNNNDVHPNVTHSREQRAEADAGKSNSNSVVGQKADQTLFGDAAKEKVLQQSQKLEEYVDYWNAHRGSLPEVQVFSDSRRRMLKARIAHGLTLDRFKAAVDKVQKTPHCLGENNGEWRVTFEFLVKHDDNITKILEGSYDGAKKPQTVRRDPMAVAQ